ncbi:MAG: glyoxylase-like metal-dependent hydrolase (beta-lactamase superfamily II) [Methylophagaceae bacterium]
MLNNTAEGSQKGSRLNNVCFAARSNNRIYQTFQRTSGITMMIRTITIIMLLSISHLSIAADAQLLTGTALLTSVKKQINNIDTQQLQEQLKKDPMTLLIDVRVEEEVMLQGGTIDASLNTIIPRGWLEARIEQYAKSRDTPIIVYSGTNIRSPFSAKTLMQMGYSNVMNYADGFSEWKKAGLAINVLDKELGSFLYSKPIPVAEDVWSAIGATAPPSYANSGHNNNLSFIVTDEGVVVINAGDNYLLASSLHDEIKKITSQPVRYVVLENEQGHASLGSNYWQQQGVPIIAHKDADAVIRQSAGRTLERMKSYARDKAWKTEVAFPDQTFDEQLILELGGQRIELLYLGPAHGPGDIVVWLPDKKLVIAGDMAFHERMLPIFEHTDTAGWLNTWDKFAALGAEIVVPGHGGPTNMAEVTKYTRDYIAYMRSEVEKILEAGGGLNDVYKIDQSAYSHLDTYEYLAKLNASTLFRMMEFE